MKVFGSALGMEGQLSVLHFQGGPCYRCIFPAPLAAEASRRCSDNGVLGTVPGKTCSGVFVFKRQKRGYVCVLFSSHSFWTSSSLDVPTGVTQEEGHTGFFIRLLSAVRALIFLARRIQPFLSLVGREVEFCVLTI